MENTESPSSLPKSCALSALNVQCNNLTSNNVVVEVGLCKDVSTTASGLAGLACWPEGAVGSDWLKNPYLHLAWLLCTIRGMIVHRPHSSTDLHSLCPSLTYKLHTRLSNIQPQCTSIGNKL